MQCKSKKPGKGSPIAYLCGAGLVVRGNGSMGMLLYYEGGYSSVPFCPNNKEIQEIFYKGDTVEITF